MIDRIIEGIKEFLGMDTGPDQFDGESIWGALRRALEEGYLTPEEQALFEKAKSDYENMCFIMETLTEDVTEKSKKIMELEYDIMELKQVIELLRKASQENGSN